MADLFLGLISGTSADAIDAALVRFEPAPGLVAAESSTYPPALRARVLELSQRLEPLALRDIAGIDVEIGRAFADAANALLRSAGVAHGAVRAIGSHGQTLLHEPRGAIPCTLQAGDPNVIAERTGITTVADFRRRDVAAGGEGAPLMPIFHRAFLASSAETRVALNLGGIANITVLARDGAIHGFDTGPANALLDAWSLRHRGTGHDEQGRWARGGSVVPALLERMLDDAYFAQPAPKSTGRDRFNLEWLARTAPDLARHAPADVQATLVALSCETIARAIRGAAPDAVRVVACGGGVRNTFLIERLARALTPVRLETSDAYGVPADFVEAVGFAWLARETLDGRPGNLPSVTGARGERVLGGIYRA